MLFLCHQCNAKQSGTKLIWGDLAMCRFLSLSRSRWKIEIREWHTQSHFPISEIDRYAAISGESKRNKKSGKRLKEVRSNFRTVTMAHTQRDTSVSGCMDVWTMPFLLHSTRHKQLSVCECFFTLLLLLLLFLLFFCSLVGAGAYQCNCIECAYFYDHSLVSLNFRWH